MTIHRVRTRFAVQEVRPVHATSGTKNDDGSSQLNSELIGYALVLAPGTVSFLFEERPPFQSGDVVTVTLEGSLANT